MGDAVTEDEGSTDTLLAAVAAIPPSASHRTKLGRYKVERKLGEGGMGVVFEATDPELERSVAVKVMRQRRESDDSLAQRLRREAQSLAKLSHPNVVAVHDVGVDDGDLYIVMQLVDGSTLDRYLAQDKRSLREILALFVAAGRGLAAAHDAGIIHRDFKPANVLVERNGHVRVSDFGLARDGTRKLATSADDPAPISTTLTTSGLVGTPAYMAPEQFDGLPISPATDQFAFCIALWEALYGQRPFSGESVGALATNVTSGKLIDPPANRRVPGWLHAALIRGLATNPKSRWPSLRALVDQLESVPRRRTRVLAGSIAGVAIVGAVGAAWIVGSHHSAEDPCTGASTRLVGIWDPTRREAVRSHLASLDAADGAARFASVAPILDDYASRWGTMEVDACRANRATGSKPDSLAARRASCLEHRLGDLTGAVGLLAAAKDAAGEDKAVMTTLQLPDIATCGDTDSLNAILPLPTDPARRKAIAEADQAIGLVDRDRQAGKLDGLDKRALAAVEQARATGYPPVLAAALKVRARLLMDTRNVDTSVEVLRELTDVAAQAKDDAIGAWAWSQLLLTLGWDLGKGPEAIALLPAARAMMVRGGANRGARVDFLYAEAATVFLDQKQKEAHAANAEAHKLLVEAGAGQPGSALTPRLADVVLQDGTLYAQAGSPELAEPLFREAIRLYTVAYGPDHSECAWAWSSLAGALRWEGKSDEAVTAYREVIRIRESRLGEGPALADALVNVGAALIEGNRYPEAVEPIDRAVTILRRGGDDAELATALMMKASVLDGVGKGSSDEAVKYLDESIAMFEKLGNGNSDLASALNNRGDVYVQRKDYAHALADLDRAIEVQTKLNGDNHPLLVDPLVTSAAVLLELHRPADAMARLDKVFGIKATGLDDKTVQYAHFLHGRALVTEGKRDAGLAEVRAARTALTALPQPAAKPFLDEIDTWLKKPQ